MLFWSADVPVNHKVLGTEEKAKVVAAVYGTKLLQFFAALAIFHQDEVKNRNIRITAAWRNGYFGKMDGHPVHAIPSHYVPYQNGCSPIHFSSNHPFF